jgi:hypothetical protein
MKLDWIRERLNMGARAYCSRVIGLVGEELARNRKWRREKQRILEKAVSYD